MLLLQLFTLLVALAALAISIYLWIYKNKNELDPDIAKTINNSKKKIDDILNPDFKTFTPIHMNN